MWPAFLYLGVKQQFGKTQAGGHGSNHFGQSVHKIEQGRNSDVQQSGPWF